MRSYPAIARIHIHPHHQHARNKEYNVADVVPTFPQRRAILDLKTQRDKLHQYQRRIKVLTDRETDIARQMLAAGDTKRARTALRKKKYQESLLAKTDAQLEQLEKLTANVEFAQIQKDVVFGLQQGTKVLKEIHAEMGGLEHVEKLMGETADAIAYQNVSLLSRNQMWDGDLEVSCLSLKRALTGCSRVQEVSEMLGGKISNQDEDEVDDELAALQAEIERPELLPEPLPEVPDTKLPTSEERPVKQPAKIKQQEPERQAMLA